MNLRALLSELGLSVDANVGALDVSMIVSDSRRVEPGAVFVAIDGARHHGSDHAAAAIEAGAIWVVAGRPLARGLPHSVVDEPRDALGALASAFHGHPSRALKVLAVTGTNGKTTVTHLVAELLRRCGERAATIGTLGVSTANSRKPGGLTTPECADLHAMLAELRRDGVTHVAIEASSHALDQRRLAGVQFAAAAWTNLSRDHLDYHGEMGAYAAAKARLFRDLLPAGAPGFVNGDDPWAASMAALAGVSCWSRGANAAAEHQLAGVRAGAGGTSLLLHSPNRPALRLKASLLGSFNADNLAAAVLLCRSQGVSDADLAMAADTLDGPPGRLQVVENDTGVLVLVDYAHTPDALQRALAEARALAGAGRVLCVFGCGGDRDRGKRPQMGEIAARGADLSIATSDNPRSESPSQIIDAIAEGLRTGGAVELHHLAPSQIASVGDQHAFLREPDRAMAIRRAIGNLQVGDVLLIAGKGHERTQTIGDEVRAFDDVQVAAGWLARHRRSGSGQVFGRRPAEPRDFSFDGAAALRACGGTLLIGGRLSKSLCTDSRSLVDDCVFVALRGERFDGNKFIAEAIDSGAAGIICTTGCGAAHLETARAAGAWILEHDDTLVALGHLGRAHRDRFVPPVIGITGSNGKTTTKELTALALSASGSVLATHANHNNRVGVPLTIARLRAGHDFAIVEMGTSEPGEIAELARIGAPTVAVLTNIGEAHLEGLGGLEGVAREKSDLLRSLAPSGVAIVPAGEALLTEHLAALPCRVWTFGRAASAEIRLLEDIEVVGRSQRFRASVLGTEVAVQMPGIGVHLADNALAALGVAAALGLNLHAAARALAQYKPVGQRMKPTQIGARLILEDCYNANPRSSEVALQTLATLPSPRVAVFGDMLELGPRAAELHERVGRAAAELGIEGLAALGALAGDYVRGAVTAGSVDACVAEDIDAVVAVIERVCPRGGTVLVKGSRGARMERVVEALRQRAEHPSMLEITSVSLAL